jgi:MFS family permease
MAASPATRLIVSAAATEGAILASFCASVSILVGRHGYGLSGSQYSMIFLLQVITAVIGALIAARSAMRLSRGGALRAGFGLSIVGLLLLIGALVPGAGATAQLPLLLVAAGLVGGGFGFVYPALTAFALDATPMHAERSVLALNLILAGGLAVSPAVAVAAKSAGAWWAVEALLCVLGLLIMAAASRSRLGPDASRSCNLHLPRQQRSAWTRVYPALALLGCAGAIMMTGWAQILRSGPAVAHPGFRLLILASFWAAAVTAARVAFAATERQHTWQRSASLVPFLLTAAVAVVGLVIGQTQTATVGVFLLAAVVCAAFMPLPASPSTQHLMFLSLACTAGLIGLYPAALGVAGPAMSHLQGNASYRAIFMVTGALGVVAGLIAAALPVWRRALPVRPEPGQQLRGRGAILVAAQGSGDAAELAPADRIARKAPRPRTDTSGQLPVSVRRHGPDR